MNKPIYQTPHCWAIKNTLNYHDKHCLAWKEMLFQNLRVWVSMRIWVIMFSIWFFDYIFFSWQRFKNLPKHNWYCYVIKVGLWLRLVSFILHTIIKEEAPLYWQLEGGVTKLLASWKRGGPMLLVTWQRRHQFIGWFWRKLDDFLRLWENYTGLLLGVSLYYIVHALPKWRLVI